MQPLTAAQPEQELSCPTCGALLEPVTPGTPTKFTCEAGHTWRMNALLKAQLDQTERGIWQAMNALEDHVALATVLADREAARHHAPGAVALLAQARAARQQVADLHRLLAAVNELRQGPIGDWP